MSDLLTEMTRMEAEESNVIEFTVYGVAQPAGSKRAFPIKDKKGAFVRNIVTDANSKAKPWQASVTAAAAEAYHGPLLDGPLELGVDVYLPRPKGHYYQTKKRNGELKDDAPIVHTKKPDLLKLVRAIEDALTGIIWRDDSQIVFHVMSKRYSEQAKAVITIAPSKLTWARI